MKIFNAHCVYFNLLRANNGKALLKICLLDGHIFYDTIEVCDEFTASQTNNNLIARLFDVFVARNNCLCYNQSSELVEDPCRKGLSFMKTRLLTINALNQKVFEKVLSNWSSAGAKVLNCGFFAVEESWWAIAEIAADTKEKPCDIVRRVIGRSELPDGHWPYGEETTHTLYYDYVMFETED